MRIRTLPALATFLLLFVLSDMGHPAQAEEFMGYEIEGGSITYIVRRDVNVRSKPKTDSKRIMGLKKGRMIQSTGHYMGWVSIVEDGQPVGFAYKKFLIPLIDGSLKEKISGTVKKSGRFECSYTVKFAGKSEAGNEVYKMADYDVHTVCKVNGRELSFSMFMFMTEGPYKRSSPSVHQINIDVLQFEYMETYDEVFSTTLFYDHDAELLRYDEASLPDLVSPPEQKELDATSVEEALSKAIAMTFDSWKHKVWQELAKELD